jgi:hypothetical protein
MVVLLRWRSWRIDLRGGGIALGRRGRGGGAHRLGRWGGFVFYRLRWLVARRFATFEWPFDSIGVLCRGGRECFSFLWLQFDQLFKQSILERLFFLPQIVPQVLSKILSRALVQFVKQYLFFVYIVDFLRRNRSLHYRFRFSYAAFASLPFSSFSFP